MPLGLHLDIFDVPSNINVHLMIRNFMFLGDGRGEYGGIKETVRVSFD